MSAVGVFAMAAPNLGKINSDIGEPNSNITWVAIVYTLMFGVGSETTPFPPGRSEDHFYLLAGPYQVPLSVVSATFSGVDGFSLLAR